jgi:hypothetical protein
VHGASAPSVEKGGGTAIYVSLYTHTHTHIRLLCTSSEILVCIHLTNTHTHPPLQLNRTVAGTDMNERSSRSHMVLSVFVEGCNLTTGVKTSGKLHLIDLAGSERLARSGAQVYVYSIHVCVCVCIVCMYVCIYIYMYTGAATQGGAEHQQISLVARRLHTEPLGQVEARALPQLKAHVFPTRFVGGGLQGAHDNVHMFMIHDSSTYE